MSAIYYTSNKNREIAILEQIQGFWRPIKNRYQHS